MSAAAVQGGMRAALIAVLLSATVAHAAGGVGERAPEVSLKDLDGKSVELSSLKGSVVILDFWASWCVPCKKELPALDALARRYAQERKPVVVVAVSVDREHQNARKLLDSLKATALTVLLDPDGKAAAAYNLPTMPSSFVIDQKGLLRHAHAGFKSGDEKQIAAEVDALLSPPKTE